MRIAIVLNAAEYAAREALIKKLETETRDPDRALDVADAPIRRIADILGKVNDLPDNVDVYRSFPRGETGLLYTIDGDGSLPGEEDDSLADRWEIVARSL
jgi:hypothetical protein